MSDQSRAGSHNLHLHRRVLNIYWIVFLISLVAEGIAFWFKYTRERDTISDYLFSTVFIPTVIQVIVLGVNECIHYFRREWPWFVVLSGTLIASALIIANKTIHIQYIFLLSMLVSLFYFNFRHLVFAFSVNMAAFAAVYSAYPTVRESMSVYEVSAFVFIMIGMLFILRSVIQRGREILTDHTRMVQSEQELLVRNALMDRMAKIDALTNLYNHKTFHEYLDLLIEQADTNSMPLQLAVLDIDNFKSINDTFGHSVGDVILARVASVLSEMLPQNEIVARYGGEEFAVIFPGVSLSEAYGKMEQVRRRIAQLAHAELDGRQVTVSVGVSEYAAGTSASSLFAEADSRLYAAKRSGKNRTMGVSA